MLFTRIASLFVTFFAVGMTVLASPVVVEVKRQDASIQNVFTTLQSATNSLIPQITALGQSGNATTASAQPLIDELTAALTTASSSLSSLQTSGGLGGILKREDDIALANLVADLIIDITRALDTLLIDVDITITVLLKEVDVLLHEILTTLSFLVAGLLFTVEGLLGSVVGLLENLGFTLTLTILGLLGIL